MRTLPVPLARPTRRPQLALTILLALGLPILTALQAAVSHADLEQYEGPMTCYECHEDVFAEVMATTHWTWEHTDPKTGEALGKNHVINNFCVAVPSNEPRCTSCHIGLGYTDKNFDFANVSKVDCLVCHDTTGTYKKTPTGAGLPDPTVNLLAVARSVGPTSRKTCGACHFFGGGGDAVKHGDLDSTLTQPLRSVDVHMGTDGANMGCAGCHVKAGPDGKGHHVFLGSHYTQPAASPALACENCHNANPHQDAVQNQHAQKVSCQACHIPAFARGGHATKMSWDWSTAGQKGPDGKPLVIKDAQGNPLYDGMKGTFTWQANVVPSYIWFNGEVDYVTSSETIDPAGRVLLTRPGGGYGDGQAKIYPIKRFVGRQPMDAANRKLAIPHLFALNANDTAAYWKGYNWTNALAAGMAYAGLPFSGQVGWVDTEMFWVQNHMVAPKEQALQCAQCHVPNGRLDFAALGYPTERAAHLQTLMGFAVDQIQRPAAGSGVTLRWMGTPGHRYQVQMALALGVAWTDAPNGERVAGASAAEMTWSEPQNTGTQAKYFRVVRRAQ